MKNFNLDMVKVTEAGAISAAEWVGRGNKKQADEAATSAMRTRLNSICFCAEIAIGEGIKDESFGLYEGEIVGNLKDVAESIKETSTSDVIESEFAPPKYSIAVDPIEGTTPTSKGGYEAMSVIAMGEKDALYKTKWFYMDKIAVGPKVASRSQINLNNPVDVNVEMVAEALGKSPQHITVCVMDRPRTKPLVTELRKIGCRIKFISDCDVTACIAACSPESGIDMYWSIGGAPEAVIAACAMKCMGGFLQCREMNSTEEGFVTVNNNILSIEDLASGEVMFAGTGITDGKLLKGVRFTRNGPVTNSIAMRSGSGTVRRMVTEHGN